MSDDPTLTLSRQGPQFETFHALDARLRLAFPPAQFHHEVVPARLSKPVFETLIRRTPFVGVGFQGMAPSSPNGSRIWRGAVNWTVFLAIQNSKKPGLLLGDAMGVGQLGVLGVALALLHGWTVRGLGTWAVGAASNMYAEDFIHDDIGLIALEASIHVEMTDEAAAAALPEFLRLGATWDLPLLDDSIINVRTPNA